jgi:hypothetical protein
MNLDIPCPQGTACSDSGVEEIGAGIAVVLTGRNHLNSVALCIGETGLIEKPVFPHVMKKLLFHYL